MTKGQLQRQVLQLYIRRADSFESATISVSRKFSDEFFHIIGPDRDRFVADELLDILSETPDPDSHHFQGYELNHRRTHRVTARLGYSPSFPGETIGVACPN